MNLRRLSMNLRGLGMNFRCLNMNFRSFSMRIQRLMRLHLYLIRCSAMFRRRHFNLFFFDIIFDKLNLPYRLNNLRMQRIRCFD